MPIIDTTGKTKEQTFAMRGYGASESPVICGYGYRGSSRLKLWFQKREGIREDFDEATTRRLWWGTELEPTIADRFTIETGHTINATQVLFRHSDHPWMTCLIDAITADGDIIDFKAMTEWSGRDLEDGDVSTLEPKHHIQAAHQMACTGAQQAIWCVFTSIANPLKIFTIPRDDELITTVIQLVREFKESVDLGIMPEEFEPSDNDFLKRKFTRVKPETIAIDDGPLVETARLYMEAKEAERYAKDEQERLQAKLRLAVGEAERAQIGPYLITRTERNRKGYSVEPKTYTDFLVTQPKERRA